MAEPSLDRPPESAGNDSTNRSRGGQSAGERSGDRALNGPALAGAILGTGALWTLLIIGAMLFPGPRLDDPALALQVVLGWMIWPALFVFALTVAIGLSRALFNRADPLSGSDPRAMQVLQRILTNSIEQTLVFVLLALAAAVLTPTVASAYLGIATALFVTGRLLFTIGYLIDPMLRSPGMAMTMNLNGGLAILVVWATLG